LVLVEKQTVFVGLVKSSRCESLTTVLDPAKAAADRRLPA
jgi:hypothetical protein